MSDVLSFLSHREKSLFYNRKILNTDFLLSRFVSRQNDVYSLNQTGENVPPYACQFKKDQSSDQSEILAVSSEDGEILLINPGYLAKDKLITSWTAHRNAIFDICWVPKTTKIISAGGDQSIVLWDAVTHQKIMKYMSHTGSIKSIDMCPGQNFIFATGARDGTIKIWDTRIQKKDCCCLITKSESTIFFDKKFAATQHKWKNVNNSKSVTCIAFQNSNYIASATCSETIVKIWDLRRTYSEKPRIQPQPKYSLIYGKKTHHGCSSMVFDSSHKILYVCSTDENIYALDCHSYSQDVMPAYYGFKANSFFVKISLSADDKYLLSGSSDEKAYAWNVLKPGPPLVSFEGHKAEVTAVAWHPYKYTNFVTCADDSKIMLWNVNKSEFCSDQSDYIGIANSLCPNSTESLKLKRKVRKISLSDDEKELGFARSLKEYPLSHFFSNLNSKLNSTEEKSLLVELMEDGPTVLPFSENKIESLNEKRTVAVSNSAVLKDKENILKSPKSSRIMNTNNKSSPKSGQKRNKLNVKNSSSAKKIKNSMKENLITSYFQGPSSSHMN